MTNRTGKTRRGGPTPAGSAIEMTAVTVSYGGVAVLDDLDASVEYGEIGCFIGLNGSGKSTALRCAGGLVKPDAGRVRVAGVNPSGASTTFWRDVVALLGDEAWYPDLTVGEHLDLFRAIHGDREVAGVPPRDELLDLLGLAGRVHVVPAVLSSGQRQRLLLAAALARPATVLLLDEPEQRLDAEIRGVLADLLLARAAAGTAVLLASHDRKLIDNLGATTYSLDRFPDSDPEDDPDPEDEDEVDPDAVDESETT